MLKETWKRLWVLIFTASGIAGTFMQVDPQEAVSHFYKWIAAVGLPCPAWLEKKNTDIIVQSVSWVFIVGSLTYFFWPLLVFGFRKIFPKKESPLTLHYLFRSDFEGDGGYNAYEVLTVELTEGELKLGTFEFELLYHGNFNAKSLFMGLYLPFTRDADKFISWFANAQKEYLENSRREIAIWPQTYDDRSQITNAELVFTNQIYIYYENVFSRQQLDEFSALYRSYNLDPVFRGLGYLEQEKLRHEQNKNRRKMSIGEYLSLEEARKIQASTTDH